MNELALFAGAGGGILGGKLLGWRTICAVEWDQYAASVLAQRQNDGHLAPFPIWDDVQTFDGRPWRGIVDVISGGFPCQDISVAGKGAGIDGERSGMWKHMARIIGEVRPRFVLVENSPALIRRGLARVLGDLAAMGYDARWGIIGADDVGAPHHRKRIWILAYANDIGRSHQCNIKHIKPKISTAIGTSPNIIQDCAILADTGSERQQRPGGHWFSGDPAEKREGETDNAFAKRLERIWGVEPGLGRVANGMANRMDRLTAIGNGQVPSVAALAWQVLSDDFLKSSRIALAKF